jgi:hypothetical protein
MKGMTMITELPKITEQVVRYPISGDYDINIWCDNPSEKSPVYWRVHLTFYPLVKGEEYDTIDTSVYYTLTLSAVPRGPKQKQALEYLQALVNEEDTFDIKQTDWWSNECVFTDTPELIADFVSRLPRGER